MEIKHIQIMVQKLKIRIDIIDIKLNIYIGTAINKIFIVENSNLNLKFHSSVINLLTILFLIYKYIANFYPAYVI